MTTPALADGMARLSDDESMRARLAVAGRQVAYEREFTEAAVVVRYQELFDRVVR